MGFEASIQVTPNSNNLANSLLGAAAGARGRPKEQGKIILINKQCFSPPKYKCLRVSAISLCSVLQNEQRPAHSKVADRC